MDHTTLLLNCYAKLKDTKKLDAFIKAPGELKFDLETAIAMCRQGGYYEQAAYLATKYGENDMVVDILVEDSKKYAEALEYIWRLEPVLVCIYAERRMFYCLPVQGLQQPDEVCPCAAVELPFNDYRAFYRILWRRLQTKDATSRTAT